MSDEARTDFRDGPTSARGLQQSLDLAGSPFVIRNDNINDIVEIRWPGHIHDYNRNIDLCGAISQLLKLQIFHRRDGHYQV